MEAPKYEKKDRYKHLLVMTIGLLVLSFVFKSVVPSIIALTIAVVGLALPVAGDAIIKGWLWFGLVMGYINSRIILSFIFFVYLVPMAFIFRLKNPHALDIRKNNKSSLFHERNHMYGKGDLEKTW